MTRKYHTIFPSLYGREYSEHHVLLFAGTPPGVGVFMKPPEFLKKVATNIFLLFEGANWEEVEFVFVFL